MERGPSPAARASNGFVVLAQVVFAGLAFRLVRPLPGQAGQVLQERGVDRVHDYGLMSAAQVAGPICLSTFSFFACWNAATLLPIAGVNVVSLYTSGSRPKP